MCAWLCAGPHAQQAAVVHNACSCWGGAPGLGFIFVAEVHDFPADEHGQDLLDDARTWLHERAGTARGWLAHMHARAHIGPHWQANHSPACSALTVWRAAR